MDNLPASQASSHFPLEPISADILCDLESRRRDEAKALGLCRSGCADIDGYVLLGGLERGSVVGISAEDEDFGVRVWNPIYWGKPPFSRGGTIPLTMKTAWFADPGPLI